jgi:signal transduction histidine kinase
MRVEQDISLAEEDIPEPLKIIIYRILQEALNNAAKHSQASRVLVSLKKVKDKIQLMIEDNGKGFDMKKVAVENEVSVLEGLGLMSMQERAELTGGSLVIESQLKKGTAIIASW